MVSSVAEHIHNIDQQPAGQVDYGEMQSNIGHIRLRPDPAVALATGNIGEMPEEINDEESIPESTAQQRRPGLLSQYMRLMLLDRTRNRNTARRKRWNRTNPKGKQTKINQQPQSLQHCENSGSKAEQARVTWDASDSYTNYLYPANQPEEPGSSQRNEDDLWFDHDNQQQITRHSSLIMRRRTNKALLGFSQALQQPSRMHSPATNNQSARGAISSHGSGFFSSVRRNRANTTNPNTTPLVNTPGVPFRHLSEALPWAYSQRQIASASVCNTPQAATRRPSISSVVGDVSTIPGVSVDNSAIDESLLKLHHAVTPNGFNNTADQTEEQQSILHAIDLLLLYQRFLVLITKALMMYGSPLHHLENNLMRTARLLDLELSASAMPGLVLLSFEDSLTHTSETKIIRCASGWDMHRLDQTNQLLRRVVYSDIEVKEAIKELETIITAAPIYAWYWQVLNWGATSWSLCLLCFGGSWADSGISLVLGLIAGAMSLAAGKFSGYTNFFEVSVSIAAGVLSAALSKWGCFGAISLSATCVLLPGLVMATGVIELSSRHMVAGTVRVFYALLLAFIISYGLLIGVEIYNKIAGNQLLAGAQMDLGQCKPLTRWSWFGLFPVAIINVAVLVNIHWRHWISVTVIAGACYGTFWVFRFYLELNDLATVVASFVLGMVANIWSKFTGQTAYMILLPGEMFLVPGSIGVRGFSSMLSQEEGTKGLGLAIQMITTCLGIMIGLFASTFLVYPRGKQYSALLTV
ncbi:pheromone-regulated protein prm10 [Coemansia guatemalensis]|uniref:Pheromone-regulated protein prm10 n=1 Tax=Coemansia guatemalensis TaxID=2761395 RepID=A0A9W8LS99_9FUNG|nr:pheromone-regulated protein prm10 [Coemansia guatemalensis]